MVSTLVLTIVAVSLFGIILGALGTRKLLQLRAGTSGGSSTQSGRRRQSKGARRENDGE